jgi:hypothetical protein
MIASYKTTMIFHRAMEYLLEVIFIPQVKRKRRRARRPKRRKKRRRKRKNAKEVTLLTKGILM